MESPPIPPDLPPQAPAAATLPWDEPNPATAGAFFDTIGLVLFHPREAFTRMSTTGSLARPIVFALLIGIPVMWITGVYDALLAAPFREIVARFGGPEQPHLPFGLRILANVFIAPFAVPAVLFVSAAVYHLMLLILGGATGGFARTLRVMGYVWATSVFGLIPVAGNLAGAIYTAVLSIIGLSAAHRISTGKSAVAVLLPTLLCCLCCGALLWWAYVMRSFSGSLGR